MTKEDFITLLSSNLTNAEICDESIFSRYAWIMSNEFPDNHRTRYREFRSFVAKEFGTLQRDVCLTGSAKLGFSLKPDVDFRAFDNENSDLDVVIVSATLFEQFWTILIKAHYSWNLKLWEGHKVNVFRRFVSFKPFKEDRIAEIRDWNVRMGEMQSQLMVKFGISNSMNYRIYRDWDAVNEYHCNGIEALRRNHGFK